MGYRLDQKKAGENEKAFMAVELHGTLQIGREGFIPFNQVLLLDSESDTMNFVESNIDLMIGIAIMTRRMEYSR